MSLGGIKAGRAFVETYIKDNMTPQLKAMDAKFKRIGMGISAIGGAMAGIGAAGVAGLVPAIMAASNMEESINRFSGVFGESAAAARQWADNFASTIGRSKKEVYDSMAAFQGLFRGLGTGSQEASFFSKRLQAMSIDFASFHNISDVESMDRFIAALSGSAEVLDQFGVNIRHGVLDLKLLEKGFPTVAAGATELQKTMARMDIIEEAMGRQGALGDAVKTAGSFANQMKSLRGAFMDTLASIGRAVLPIVTPVIGILKNLMVVVAKFAEQNPQMVAAIAIGFVAFAAIGSILIVVGGAITFAVTAFTAISGAIAAIGPIVAAVFTPMGGIIAGVVVGVLALGYAAYKLGQWFLTATGPGMALVAVVKSIGGSILQALSAGDFALAGQIAMAALELAMFQGVSAIKTLWIDFKTFLIDTIFGAMRGVLGAIIAAVGKVSPMLAALASGSLAGVNALGQGVKAAGNAEMAGRDKTEDVLSSRLAGLQQAALTAAEAVAGGVDPDSSLAAPAAEAAAAIKTVSTGTFSAAQALAMGKNSSTEKKQIALAEKQTKLLEKIASTLDRGDGLVLQ